MERPIKEIKDKVMAHLLKKEVQSMGPIFRSLPAMYLVMDASLHIIDATDLYETNTQSNREDFVGKHILDTFPENPNASHLEAKQQLAASLESVLTHRQPHIMPLFRFDITAPDSDNYEEHFWETTNHPILDKDHNLQYILLETRDVTALKHQEQETTFNRTRLSLLAGVMDAVTWEYESANGSICWSSDIRPAFGYTAAQMPSGRDTWKKLIHPQDLPGIEESINQTKAAGENIWTGKYRFRTADGTYVDVLDQRYMIYDRQGRIRRIIGSLINVSRNDTAAATKEVDARFQHLLEVLPYMAWAAAPNGHILYFNRAWHSFTGMPRSHTDRWVSYVHPEDTAEVLTRWHEAVRTGSLFEVEYRVYNKFENTFQWFMERGEPLRDEKGNITLWVGSYTDIHDRKTAEEQL